MLMPFSLKFCGGGGGDTAATATTPTAAASTTPAGGGRGRGWRNDHACQHPRVRVGAVALDAPHDRLFRVRGSATLRRQPGGHCSGQHTTGKNGKLHELLPITGLLG